MKFDFNGCGSRELDAMNWSGDRPCVTVACNRQTGEGGWEPGVSVVLENRGSAPPRTGVWEKIAEFTHDAEIEPVVSPGELRFRLQQSDEIERAFTLSIAECEPVPAKPPTLEQRVAKLESERGAA